MSMKSTFQDYSSNLFDEENTFDETLIEIYIIFVSKGNGFPLCNYANKEKIKVDQQCHDFKDQ